MCVRQCCRGLNDQGSSVAVGAALTVLHGVAALGLTVAIIYEAARGSDSPRGLPPEFWPMVVGLGVVAVHLVFDGLLLVGALRSSQRLLLVAVVYHGVVFLVQTLGVISAFVLGSVSGIAFIFAIAAASLAVQTILWSCWNVVVRYYLAVRSSEHHELGEMIEERPVVPTEIASEIS